MSKAQELADEFERSSGAWYKNDVFNWTEEAATLLRAQDELLRQALGALTTAYEFINDGWTEDRVIMPAIKDIEEHLKGQTP